MKPSEASYLSGFPSKPEPGFDPADQMLAFYARDGQTVIGVPMTTIDDFNAESISMGITSGAEIGACLIILAAIIVLTPLDKLRRPTAVFQMVALFLCLARAAFEISDLFTPIFHFYIYWAGDYTGVPRGYIYRGIAGHVVTMLVNMAVELTLMNQAWTMVSLFSATPRLWLTLVSALVALVVVGLRITFAVMLSQVDVVSAPRSSLDWIMQATLISNTISIFWFCALFNSKLVLHIIANRGILSSSGRKLSSMEVLVMTNGVLMVIPVIFAGLEYGNFRNFEPARLTIATVAVILPLGTLAAQRINTPTSSKVSEREADSSNSKQSGTAFSNLRKQSMSSSSASPFSKCERGRGSVRAGATRVEDPYDLELRRIDTTGLSGILIDQKLEQRYESV
ncbi:hypothetical protein CDD80_5989 [Ophiocordyceps camponoti-rufipedis]|uniref:Pheromone receptor n=1 Tax=Ophiocordyceps camponoti-rufipedis TaxID=2004952 RepID=A0A2C5YSI7_9HYPO|nr:hypothetical protein CDD80_5989 [Ophiocordyceps camponoti-rufipedis]